MDYLDAINNAERYATQHHMQVWRTADGKWTAVYDVVGIAVTRESAEEAVSAAFDKLVEHFERLA